MVVLPDEAGSAHAVARMQPTLENPEGFHRLIGGGVEHGETALEAVRREVREELGATLLDAELLGVLENIFELDGEPGHEVVFVHTGRLDPVDTVPPGVGCSRTVAARCRGSGGRSTTARSCSRCTRQVPGHSCGEPRSGTERDGIRAVVPYAARLTGAGEVRPRRSPARGR